MEKIAAVSETPMHRVSGCLVVPIQVELSDDVALRIQRDILRRVDETAAKGVVLDVSGVNVIDSFLAQSLAETARMTSLLGAPAVLVGLKPEVAAALVNLDYDLGDLRTASTLERGLDMLGSSPRPEDGAPGLDESREEEHEDTGRAD